MEKSCIYLIVSSRYHSFEMFLTFHAPSVTVHIQMPAGNLFCSFHFVHFILNLFIFSKLCSSALEYLSV